MNNKNILISTNGARLHTLGMLHNLIETNGAIALALPIRRSTGTIPTTTKQETKIK